MKEFSESIYALTQKYTALQSLFRLTFFYVRSDGFTDIWNFTVRQENY